MRISKPVVTLPNQNSRRLVSLTLLLLIGAVTFLEFSLATPACKAESEASSEAGLEAPVNMRRRRRYRYRQNPQNTQNQQVRQERQQEARERNQQQRREQKQLSRGPQIKSYGPARRQGLGEQGAQGQNPTQP